MDPALLGQSAAASPPSTPSTTSTRRKYKRASAGKGNCCRTCRLRKVRCAGNPGNGEACTNCTRLKLDCGFKNAADSIDALNNISRTTPSSSHTEAGTARKRAQRACKECHTHKTRCSGNLPRCERCATGDLVCEYTPARRRRVNQPDNASDPVLKDSGKNNKDGHVETLQPDEESKGKAPASTVVDTQANRKVTPNKPCFVDIEELSRGQSLSFKGILKQHFEAYLDHLFYLPCLSFIHPPTTLQAIEDGTLPPPFAAALCASTTPFLNPGHGAQDFGARCMDQVELHIWRTMDTFSEELLTLCALGMAFDFFSGSFAKPWQSLGVGVRLMLGLQINWDSSVVTSNASKGASSALFVKQEATRRLAWFLFCFDKVLAGGYDEYVSCRRETMRLRLPCDDQAFLDGKPVDAPRLDDNNPKLKGKTGIAGFGVYIIDLRHQIQAYTRALTGRLCRPGSKREPSSFMSDVNEFQTTLSQLHASLPLYLRLSEQSIAAHMCRPEQAGYCYFHTHFLVAHIDLYRFALPGFQQKSQHEAIMKLPREFIEKSQRQAISYAICLAKLCEAIMTEYNKGYKRRENGAGGTRKVLNLPGDATIFHMSTQGLRVLLVALQHRLYEGLDLAQHSTVPLWRVGSFISGRQIRGLIDSLLKIGEPWADVMIPARHAHEMNIAMVEQFDKTHRFADQPGTVNHTAAVLGSGPSKLPGPHYVLDSMHIGNSVSEQRARSHAAAARSWWTKGGLRDGDASKSQASPPASHQTAPVTDGDGTGATHYVPIDLTMTECYGPPGVPMALAQARGVNLGVIDANMYAVDDTLEAMAGASWPMPDISAIINEHSQQQPVAAGGDVAFLQQQYGGMVDEPWSTWPTTMPGLGPYYTMDLAAETREPFLDPQQQTQPQLGVGSFGL